ncbi:response regulator [Persicimonas caeni]|nr:response regulator transcription factor [Persicimonas caeni]
MTTTRTQRVFVVDDHATMRQSLQMLLEILSSVEFCGEAEMGGEALTQIPQASPDMVIVDLSLPDMSGLEVVRRLGDEHPAIKALVVSGHSEKRHVQDARDAGARGFVPKGQADQLREAIETVLAGQTFFPR